MKIIELLASMEVKKLFNPLVIVSSLLLLSACSLFGSHEPIDDITVIEQGKNIAQRPKMAEVCKGFHISEEKFKRFYEHASITHEDELNARYKALPCFSSGTVLFDGVPFQWVIRAGGVGEFYNETTSFTKVCGIACCKAVDGVC